MTVEKKRLAVITAAVSAFLEAEKKSAAPALAPRPAMAPWGISGRLEMMTNRIMMQRRAFRQAPVK